MINFVINKEQEKKLNKWVKSLPPIAKKYVNVDTGNIPLIYKFIPTGIGIIVKVERADGKEIDLTEYEYF